MINNTPIIMNIILRVNASGGAIATTVNPQATAKEVATIADVVSDTFDGTDP
ncbi:hypothetical protein P053_00564 [Brucella abortus 01-4165]|uniref:Uncharacterized protein n=7 Tax=Brucella TaxID=234 RepID=Q579Z0_BRUAB|nr:MULTISPECIES: hypothetical protein [Brucella]AAX75544.1 hypothetical protein BruAb2_0093 [Brucella abortus bv. 1 str. 9-941]ABQ62387.1 conserved hypothetical protein [Brucella ovis ATCC 25840]ABY39125.1 Hypothetical protein, conserved [Brucella suis ATCC 23445]ACD73613.1 hypothetical protein BAbS19_II00860 [Brucella abortus S19]ACO01977.1 Hypothetical protein, conserved [Brucella melitensis ATCC 23457]AIJ87663.1 hypothetical protein DK63_2117 [Brucella melitensis bv. 1 str. 16M]AIJ91659.1